jgi:hypothetical protein
MPNKQTSFRLVKDKFLSKKFKNKNQHKLSIWFSELAPEINWVFGEFIITTHLKKSCNLIVPLYHSFMYAVNANDKTVVLSLLDTNGLSSQQEILESTFVGKRILEVYQVDGAIDLSADINIHKMNSDLYDIAYDFLVKNDKIK